MSGTIEALRHRLLEFTEEEQAMNAEHLLQHFDHLSEAPDAIPRLRRFILDLAVRGKLVEQDPNDEPASELLKRIETEKVRLAKEGKIRKSQSLAALIREEVPFDLPQHWDWIRLGNIGFTQTGTTPPTSKPECFGDFIPFVKPADLTGNTINYGGKGLSKIGIQHSRLIPGRSALMVCIGSSIGKVNVTDREVCCNQQINTVTPYLDGSTAFTSFALRGSYFQELVLKNAGMGTLPIISKGKWEQLPIPLPPLAEQHRIVAKVDELMALCDQLEAAKTEREQSRDRLVAASLYHLNPPADAEEANAPEAFRDHARFVFNHLPRLTTRPEHIKQLRQTILNLAVRGKLVPQDPNDEPAPGLPNRINLDEEGFGPFVLPDSWKWAKVKEIADMRLGKMLDRAKNKGTERRYLRNVNVRWFDFDLSDVLTMRFEDSELEEFSLRVGDVLICEGGEPGRSAVWDGREQNIYFQKAIHRVRFSQGINPHYFVAVLKQSADSGRLAEYFTGVGIKHFTGKGLSSFLVPLPPVAEQHRIVAKVDGLMVLCDQLEAQLSTTEADSRRLLEAVLYEALHPPLAATEHMTLEANE